MSRTFVGLHNFKTVTYAMATEDGKDYGCQSWMTGGVLLTGVFILTIHLQMHVSGIDSFALHMLGRMPVLQVQKIELGLKLWVMYKRC